MITKDTYIISDYHFGHFKLHNEYEPIRKLYKENFNDFEDSLIENWNNLIDSNTKIVVLGDLLINKIDQLKTLNTLENISKRLNGIKYLLKGNHDTFEDEIYEDLGWILVGNEKEKPVPYFILDDIIFSHFPLIVFENRKFPDPFEMEKNKVIQLMKDQNINFNIHGHMHSRKVGKPNFFNVSCECLNFTPIKIKDINFSI